MQKDTTYCSKNCPYLKQLTQEHKLPHYCELFQVFLGMDKDNILRTSSCLGKQIDTKTTGYNLISAYNGKYINKQKTKWGFLRLGAQLQNRFVHILKKEGTEIGVSNNFPLNAPLITNSLTLQIQDNENPIPHHLAKNRFNILLDKLSDNFPELLNSTNQQLLLNLFMVLDSSEQSMLESILSNPNSNKSFLKTFESMPKTENLLKDLRRQLKGIAPRREDEDEIEKRNRLLQQQMAHRMYQR